MKFYFGKVPQQDVQEFGALDLYYNEGEFYYYCLEYGTNPGGLEEVALRDTCGRMVPVAIDYVRELAAALVECNNIAAEIESAEHLTQEMQDDEGTASVNKTDIEYN